MHDIIVAEYLCDQITRETDAGMTRARAASDFEDVAADIAHTRTTLDELVDDGRELIRALEADEASNVQSWKEQTITASRELIDHAADLAEALVTEHANAATDWPVLIDRAREDARSLRPLLNEADTRLQQCATLLVLDADVVTMLESLRESLRELVDDRHQVLAAVEARKEALDGAAAHNLNALLNEVSDIRQLGDRKLADIDSVLRSAVSQRATLDWIQSYRQRLRGTKQRVFARAFDNRLREVMEHYRVLRQQMTRLLTTLVLASDASAQERVQHFGRYGFHFPVSPGTRIRNT